MHENLPKVSVDKYGEMKVSENWSGCRAATLICRGDYLRISDDEDTVLVGWDQLAAACRASPKLATKLRECAGPPEVKPCPDCLQRLDRMVQAAAVLECAGPPETVFSVREANEAYARLHGVAVAELTEAQRHAAFRCYALQITESVTASDVEPTVLEAKCGEYTVQAWLEDGELSLTTSVTP